MYLFCSVSISQTSEHQKIYIYMDPFSGGSKLISIKKSVNAKQHIMLSLVALHAIPGCDTVPMMFGIGKIKSLKL